MSNYPEGVSDADFEGPVKEELEERTCPTCVDLKMEAGHTHIDAVLDATAEVEVAVYGYTAQTERWTCIYGHDYAGNYEGGL